MTPTLSRLARFANAEHAWSLAQMRMWVAVAVIFLTPLTSNLRRGVPIPLFHLNAIILLQLISNRELGNSHAAQ